MPTRNPPSPADALAATFAEFDEGLAPLERAIASHETLPLAATVERAIGLVRMLVVACIAAEGRKPLPGAGADLLATFRVLVKGDPTWTAIRDNCRELVYYSNCIKLGREDALPAVPAKMAVRTARHVGLYIRTRCVREGRLQG